MTKIESGPAIVLVGPQLGENIGAAARAMLNCGLTDLRLVRPRDGWPSRKAQAAAVGAAPILERARLYDTTREAVADLHHVYATTSRHRDMRKEEISPRQAVEEMRRLGSLTEASGVVFGPERTGLTNEDIVCAGKLLQIPLNPDFASLNLAQAVLLVAYEWLQAGVRAAPVEQSFRDRAATGAELENFFDHLEGELDAASFFRVKEKRPIMVQNLRNLFHRAGLSAQEVLTLHGLISALAGRRKDGKPVRQPRPRRGTRNSQ